MKSDAKNRVGQIARNVAIYAASSWAVIEALDFLINRYFVGNERHLDAALFVAVVGTGIVAVVTWFHGRPGRQAWSAAEKIVVAALVVTSLTGALIIATADPYKEFLREEGFRLAVAFRNDRCEGDCEYGFTMNAADDDFKAFFRMASDPDVLFFMNPKDFRLTLPGVLFEGAGTPTDIRHGAQREYAQVTTILPAQPEDLGALLDSGQDHTTAHIEYSRMSLQIDRPFELHRTDNGVIFRITGPLLSEDALPSE